MSVNDDYNDPGELVMRKINNISTFLKKDDYIYFINNTGATPEGNLPFLIKMNLNTLKSDTLFKCNPKNSERIYGFTNEDLTKILIRSENQTTPREYFIYNLITKERTLVEKK